MNCNILIQMLHDIINTLPVTHDEINMTSLIYSLIKVFNMYMNQCVQYYPMA